MTPDRIAELLEPFLPAPLAEEPLNKISMYIDLLLRWNARINLTAVRKPEEIVTRHFGESLFAASRLRPREADALVHQPAPLEFRATARTVDLGSGAGFPGIPLKIWSPQTSITLIESNHKRVTFLREVIRALRLADIDVFEGRAEDFPVASASLITLRAVERFASVLPTAQVLLAPAGRLALLIGESQAELARQSLPSLQWSTPIPLPGSQSRILLLGVQN